jgi:hypothetical protein
MGLYTTIKQEPARQARLLDCCQWIRVYDNNIVKTELLLYMPLNLVSQPLSLLFPRLECGELYDIVYR